ncbi:hypothetical protein FA014_02940 [Cellulomonas hominis]|uniref:HNH nuclease domain-containing protein n=1 Tax=Cellulomonas hominis TaxID=156981 RepID=A0A7Z8NQH3_9CELL|nr:HNH endonuclease [Cellulomonas hominis]TKR26971.1 hypothetical protein FA014_02940 [Cellulomonas hominis]
MARIIRMSTQVGDSAENARRALDRRVDLRPIAAFLADRGARVPTDGHGYLWGFKPRSPVITAAQPLTAGDVALRIEKIDGIAHVTSAYVVAYVALNDPSLPRRVGVYWQGDGGWANSVVFDRKITPPRAFPYSDYMDAFGWVTGFNYKADFLSVPDVELFLESFAAGIRPADHDHRSGAPATAAAEVASPAMPDRVAIDNDPEKPWPRPGANTRPARPEQPAFRQEVLRVYADPASGTTQCAACDVHDSLIIEAAHVVDFGRGPDRWYNGLPLCRNHHRYFDMWMLRLDDGYRWHPRAGGPSLSQMGVTRADINHLGGPGRRPRPHLDVVRWKWTLSGAGAEDTI